MGHGILLFTKEWRGGDQGPDGTSGWLPGIRYGKGNLGCQGLVRSLVDLVVDQGRSSFLGTKCQDRLVTSEWEWGTLISRSWIKAGPWILGSGWMVILVTKDWFRRIIDRRSQPELG